MTKTVDRRLAFALFFVAIFVLCQVMPLTQRRQVIHCSLADYNQISEQFLTTYGAPLPVVGFHTTTDCFGNPTPNISDFYFSIEGLLVDILFAVVLGILPYFSFWLVQRFRRHNNAE